MRTRKKLTHAEVQHDNRTYTVVFKPDGLHIKEKFSRNKRVITLIELITGTQQTVTKSNAIYKSGSASETLHLAACDLATIADHVHRKQLDKSAIVQVAASVKEAGKLLRGLEFIAG